MVSRVRSIPRVGVLFQLHGLSVEKTADQIWADQEDERTGEPITVQPSIIPYFDYFYPCVVSEQPKIYLKDELYFSIEWGGSFLKKGQSTVLPALRAIKSLFYHLTFSLHRWRSMKVAALFFCTHTHPCNNNMNIK